MEQLQEVQLVEEGVSKTKKTKRKFDLDDSDNSELTIVENEDEANEECSSFRLLAMKSKSLSSQRKNESSSLSFAQEKIKKIRKTLIVDESCLDFNFSSVSSKNSGGIASSSPSSPSASKCEQNERLQIHSSNKNNTRVDVSLFDFVNKKIANCSTITPNQKEILCSTLNCSKEAFLSRINSECELSTSSTNSKEQKQRVTPIFAWPSEIQDTRKAMIEVLLQTNPEVVESRRRETASLIQAAKAAWTALDIRKRNERLKSVAETLHPPTSSHAATSEGEVGVLRKAMRGEDLKDRGLKISFDDELDDLLLTPTAEQQPVTKLPRLLPSSIQSLTSLTAATRNPPRIEITSTTAATTTNSCPPQQLTTNETATSITPSLAAESKISHQVAAPRRFRLWRPEEEEALMRGYEKFGNQWKLILESEPILHKFSSMQLKDKSKNLCLELRSAPNQQESVSPSHARQNLKFWTAEMDEALVQLSNLIGGSAFESVGMGSIPECLWPVKSSLRQRFKQLKEGGRVRRLTNGEQILAPLPQS